MKKKDILVFWLDGSDTKFPAVVLKSMVVNNKQNKAATMTFKFGPNGHIATINLDNIKFFEITESCSE